MTVISESDIGLLFGVTGVRFWPYAACSICVGSCSQMLKPWSLDHPEAETGLTVDVFYPKCIILFPPFQDVHVHSQEVICHVCDG